MSDKTNEVVEKLQGKLGGPLACPICKGESIMPNRQFCALPVVDTDKKMTNVEGGVAAAALVCMHCGHVMLFSTVVLDVAVA